MKKIFIPLVLFSLISIIFFYNAYIYYSKNLPDIHEITSYQPKTITKIYDKNNKLIGLFFDEKREFRDINKIPPTLINAFISAEDKNFFNHHGYDPFAYFKAIISFFRDWKLRGASTITQQITKGFLLSGERTFERKIKEFILALRLENALSKNEILELYLNEVYLGEKSYGVVSASYTYFAKDLHELTPGEAAFLASLPKSPDQYNPKVNITNAVNRRNFVLKEMLQNGYINEEIFKNELKKELITNLSYHNIDKNNYKLLEGFLADEIRLDLNYLFDNNILSSGDIKIKTSLDLDLQIQSNKILNNELINLDTKTNYIKPPVKSLVSLNFDIKNWKEILQNFDQQKIIPSWDLGVIAKIENNNFYIKTKTFDNLFKLHFPYSINPNFSIGDIVYYKIEKKSGRFIYQQIPNFDGGVLILERDTNKILALNGGFSYLTSGLNMVTEKKQNLKKALFPFLNFLIVDQSTLLDFNKDLHDNLNIQKKFKNIISSNSNYKESDLITLNKKNINELSYNLISKIEDTSLMIANEKEIIFNSEISLFDLMSYYRILLSKNFPSKIKLIEKVYLSKKEVFNFEDTNQISHKSNEIIKKILIKNNKIINFLNLQSFLIKNFETKFNNKNFHGWNIFDEKKGFTLFIGFNDQKIIGCYINQINLNHSYDKNNNNLVNNSCVNVVKKLL